ncbi:hypothetical protein jhhlp_005490 [Lomentospora prolificans]|uniref:LicD/FKTN/FKRP nucleotidyltransferase domain-containing protein n=1 Tax=Lomentospora prolificans TaxID=41688 RepID=A0A2N3N389_9PEZI|nr:hypothetical protein jhhlp_005490 [Lomentospora prolificans]
MRLGHALSFLAALPLALGKDNKYFHEPGGDHHLGHYDIRYFREQVSYDDHRHLLRHLIRSYLSTLDKIGAETWIAHGTLLGWWWNGQIMPWDYDLDVQMSTDTLRFLGNEYNRTEHTYSYVDNKGVTQNKTYLLDINPHHIDIDRGDGQNIIDARWIDMDNGMFVDITGLMERDPNNNPGQWSCKNHHKYKTTDLFPMRSTEFEGVRATVPYNFEKILIDEYGTKSLVTTSWLGHDWIPEKKEWVKTFAQIKKEQEEARKKAEEEKKKAEEEKKKAEEEKKRAEEEKKKAEEEEEKRGREEEENERQDQLERRKKEQEENLRQEEEKRAEEKRTKEMPAEEKRVDTPANLGE